MVSLDRSTLAEITDNDIAAEYTLTHLLDMITEGSTRDLLAPLGESLGSDKILSLWDDIYHSNKSKINKVLDNIEMSNREKFGPRSIAKPWSSRKEKFYSTFGYGEDLDLPVPKSDNSLRLRPLSITEATKYLKNSTNSGLPYLRKKVAVKPFIVDKFHSTYGRFPAVLFTRTQEGGKTRDVWGYPISDTLGELMYYRPLLSYQSKAHWRAALLSPKSLDKAMNLVLKQNKLNDQYLVSSDISGYDNDCKFSLQKTAFNYIKSLYMKQYHSDIDVIFSRFNTIPIVCPDGVITGPHGIPSGSTFTNEVGSIIQYSVYDSCGCVDMRTIQCQGDDGIVSTSNPDVVFQQFEKYNLKINVDKSDVSKEYCTYLQFLYHPDYVGSDNLIGGVYSTYRALNRIIHLERFIDLSKEDIDGKDYFAIRTISILENCKHHPLFKEFVHFVWTLDKYKLHTSDLGIRQFVDLKRRQEGKDVSFSVYTYGDEIRSIKDFETFKLISEFNRK